ncbi:MAG: isochorismate synthase [Actinomycetota bacterium]|nr:isochorismate synthase [Actinomycetota bacterium]
MTTSLVGDADAAALVVRTQRVADPGPLLALLPSLDPLVWVRRGQGLVGWGAVARTHITGAHRFAAAQDWWDSLARHTVVRDDVQLPGTGLVTFGSFSFVEAGQSTMVVPEVVVGHRTVDGEAHWWVTTATRGSITGPVGLVASDPPAAPSGLTFADGAMSGAEWAHRVSLAVSRIGSTPLEKVVLARDLLAAASEDIDVRWPVRQLAASYPSCWTYHVDGLFGATPEMLVRRERGLVTSRVLAGTIRRTGDDEHDLALAGALARSSKDLEEHEYAVRSVASALAQHCSSMNVPETPFVLHLPNVMHLASDVAGVGSDSASSLRLAAALHPSAAVGGTPTDLAVSTLGELESMDRGRYAGPVGWMDADGDGEWGLALRCGVLTGARVRLFAGCGIVAGSDPAAELAEAQAKFIPVRDALSG